MVFLGVHSSRISLQIPALLTLGLLLFAIWYHLPPTRRVRCCTAQLLIAACHRTGARYRRRWTLPG
jgi:hypothetical protein